MNAWIEALIRASAQGSFAVLIVWGLVRLFPQATSATRCWLWRLAALKFLVSLSGAIEVPILPAAQLPPAAPIPLGAYSATLTPASVRDQPDLPMPSGPAPDPWLGLWICGAVAAAVNLAIQTRAAQRLAREAQLAPEEARARQLAEQMGIRSTIRVARHPEVVVPMLIGTRPPVVILPANRSGETQDAVLAHELAHVRRRDPQWALALTIVRVPFWFVPTLWLACHEAREEAESACDADALDLTRADPRQYAQTLISYSGRRPPAFVQTISGPAKALKRRILAMNASRPSPHACRRAATLLMLPLVLALVPWTAVAKPQAAKLEATDIDRFEAYLIQLPSVKRGLRTTPDQEKRIHEVWTAYLQKIRELGNRLAELERRGASNRERYALEPERTSILREEAAQTLAVLTGPQRNRLKQMALQYNGEQWLAYPEVASQIQLSAAKRAQIFHLVTAFRAKVRELQTQVDLNGSDPKRLSPAERRTFERLRQRLLDATGEERKKLMALYWPLYQKTWTHPRVTAAQIEAQPVRRERNRKLSLQEKARTNSKIREILSPEERRRWQTLIGPKAYFDVLPYAWG